MIAEISRGVSRGVSLDITCCHFVVDVENVVDCNDRPAVLGNGV